MTGYEFRITLRRDETECRFTTPHGEVKTCTNVKIRRDAHLETIELLEKWLQRWEWIVKADSRGRLLVPDTFEVLGNHLWNLALEGDIGAKLIEACKFLDEQDEETVSRIRVRMSFQKEARDLARLPWEFLRYPGTVTTPGFFLAAKTNLVLGRFLDGVTEGSIRKADQAVRVLFVVALPTTDEFREERDEIKALREVLGEVDALEIKDVDGWEPSEVIRKLAEFRDAKHVVDVVHLVGVCQDRQGKPVLYLPDGRGGDQFDDAAQVVDVLTHDRKNQPALVVLHLSDWERESPEHFEQLAPAFVQAGIPAVLAMQYPMPADKGRAFVGNFYERLASGEPIGAAVQMARNALFLGKPNRQFGTPVLYMQSTVDGKLLERSASEEPDEDERPVHSALRSIRPLNRAPSSGGQPKGHRQDITHALLRVLDDVRPQTAATNELRRWVDDLPPDDIGAILQLIRVKRRDNLDNGELRRLCELLLEFVQEQVYGEGS